MCRTFQRDRRGRRRARRLLRPPRRTGGHGRLGRAAGTAPPRLPRPSAEKPVPFASDALKAPPAGTGHVASLPGASFLWTAAASGGGLAFLPSGSHASWSRCYGHSGTHEWGRRDALLRPSHVPVVQGDSVSSGCALGGCLHLGVQRGRVCCLGVCESMGASGRRGVSRVSRSGC